MKTVHIGLIGGIGPAATDFYYRRLIAAFAAKHAALELTIAHADTPTLLKISQAMTGRAGGDLHGPHQATCRGGNCVVVTSIAGHFCIDDFKAGSPLLVVDMIVEVRRAIETRGLSRIGILGTRPVMETRFYGGLPSVEIVRRAGKT